MDFVGERNVDNRPVWISIRHTVTKFGSKEGETHYIIIVLVGKISGQGNIFDHFGMQNKVISKWGQSNGFGRWLWGPRIKDLGTMYGGIGVAHEHSPATWGSKKTASFRQHFWEFLASNIDEFFTPWIKYPIIYNYVFFIVWRFVFFKTKATQQVGGFSWTCGETFLALFSNLWMIVTKKMSFQLSWLAKLTDRKVERPLQLSLIYSQTYEVFCN